MAGIPLNYVLFGSSTGYGQSAQDMVFSLINSGKYDIRIEVLFKNKPDYRGMTDDRKNIMESLRLKPLSKDMIQVLHCIPPIQRHASKLAKTIGWGLFETFSPPNGAKSGWINILNKNDAIATPSHFDYKVFAHEKLTKPLYRVPASIDTNLFNTNVEPLVKRDKFTFLYFGTWRKRKGYPELLETWYRNFSSKDGVQLLIKTDKTEHAMSYVRKIKHDLGFDKKDIAPILFENKVLDEIELPRFFKSVDCLISPTRGEGFGLPGLQCMALGIPIIITDFSGCQDYATEDTCTLIKPAGFVLVPSMDGLPQFSQCKWPYITTGEIGNKMQYVLNNFGIVQKKAEYAANFVSKEFSYEQSAEKFDQMIREVYNL